MANEVDYMGYARYMGARNPLAEGINQIGGTLDSIQKQQMLKQQMARQNSLSDMQLQKGGMEIDQLQQDAAYKQRLKEAMANPQSRTLTSIAPNTMPTDAQKLGVTAGGSQMPNVDVFGTNAPQVGPLASRVTEKTIKETPYQAGARFAASEGKTEDVSKMLSLDDVMGKLATNILMSGGDPEQFRQAQAVRTQAQEFAKMITPFAGKPEELKLMWPILQKAFPELAGTIAPESIQTQRGGTVIPLVVNGQVIPGKGIHYDKDGKDHVIDLADKESLQDARFAQQTAIVNKQIEAAAKNTQMQIAASDRRAMGTSKPMPSSALKMQQDATDAMGLANSLRADLGAIKNQVDKGQLKLGPVSNIAGSTLNKIGLSTENSRNLATFKATLEKLRNDSLRLNKGVQTEGDAQRAWNELLTNITDEKLVSKRLDEIDRINERASMLQEENLNNIRENYGKAPLNVSKQKNVKSALSSGAPKTSGRFTVEEVK